MINHEKDDFLWVERYRPKTIQDCILPEKLKSIFLGILEKGDIPNLLLYGPAGSGKTTVARALCKQLDNDCIILNGSLGAEESGIEAFRTRVKSFASSVSFNGNRKVVIIDESDYLNPNSSQPALRALIEEFARNCAFIFTCNYKNRIIEPIHSRCSVIEFKIDKEEKPKIATSFLKRIFHILEQEGIKFDDKKIVADLVMKHFPDFRRSLNELQRFTIASGGIIDEGVLVQNVDVDLNFAALYKALKEKNFNSIRKWVVESLSEEPSKIYRKIYDSLYQKVKPQSIPPLIVLLADYSYKSAFVADQEINLLAFLVEMMVDNSIEML
jgi:DNA polymerase III delta prime subunit